ncbi:MAG: bacteriocin fulvocin C-related protein [Saprospiraceae bacterium]|nr:bacteriocin fulvocin C-related protein [Saprospiraceae bacterium]
MKNSIFYLLPFLVFGIFSCQSDEFIQKTNYDYSLYKKAVIDGKNVKNTVLYQNYNGSEKAEIWLGKFNDMLLNTKLNEEQTMFLQIFKKEISASLFSSEDEAYFSSLEAETLAKAEGLFEEHEITYLFYKLKNIHNLNAEESSALQNARTSSSCECNTNRQCIAITSIGPGGVTVDYLRCIRDHCQPVRSCGFLGLSMCQGECFERGTGPGGNT